MDNQFFFKLANSSKNGSCFFIAEAGVNHNGQLEIARKLIEKAANAGADAIKFQTFRAEDVVTKTGKMASYQEKNTKKTQSQLEMLRSLELKEEYYPELIKHSKKQNILFLSTPHGGKNSVDVLERYNIPMYKIGSGDLTNYILLDYIAQTKKPVILSSGMATMQEVVDSIDNLKNQGVSDISMLHCTTNYPCPLEDVNLNAMLDMINTLDVPIGYSDHTEGIQTAIMAVTLGAKVYECHFTLNKQMPGPDHIASNDPKELREKITAIKNVSTILGTKRKEPTKSEYNSMVKMVRKSIVLKQNISKGHLLTYNDLEAKRPGDGLSPSMYKDLLNKKTNTDLVKDHKISLRDIQ